MYIPRVSDAMLSEYLNTFGAVLVEGCKWCGKTTSSAMLAASELRIADSANDYQNKRLAQLDTSSALAGGRPRLIDEWQEVPALWDAVRYECDQALGASGQFILTGSATPSERSRPIHSGAGRIGRVRMDTMTLVERGISSGKTSLAGLFEDEAPQGISAMTLPAVADAVCHGGWPAAVDMSTRQSQLIARGYLDAVATEDMEKVDGVRRDAAKVRALFASLARNESTLATKRAIIADMGEGVSASTLDSYLSVLQRIFFIDDIPAWSPALRSPIRIRAAAKHHMADTSLAAAALLATPETLLADVKTLGLLFESLAAHDLMVYARAMGGRVVHYRDDSNLEVDLIVELPDGRWGAFEVKLGAVQEEDAARNLKALERKLVARGERPPAVKAVLVGVGGICCKREDGVCVVPLDVLGA